MAYGPEGHPFARGIKELFVLWFKILMPLINKQHSILEKLDEAWSQIYIELTRSDKKEKNTRILTPPELYQIEVWNPFLELPYNEITIEKKSN